MSKEILDIQPKRYKRSNMMPETYAKCDEITALCTLAKDSLRITRPAIFPDTEQGLTDFRDAVGSYFDFLNAHNQDTEDPRDFLIPDIESLCVYLHISRNCLLQYERRDGAFGQYVRMVKDGIFAVKKSLAMKNKLSPVLTIFDATNNFGYCNASEFKVSSINEDERKETSLLPVADGLLGIED